MAASNIRIKKICQWCGVEFEALYPLLGVQRGRG